MTNRNLYIPTLRPASSFCLPQGVKWEYAQQPGIKRPGLPQTAERYGVIRLDRELTRDECERFDLTPASYFGEEPIAGLIPLTWAEVAQMREALHYLIPAYRIAKLAADQSALADSARQKMSRTIREIVTIGNKLTTELVSGCDSLAALLDKHADHGYRPTLRGCAGTPESMLADCYDLLAESRGLSVRAYRG